MFKGGRAGLRAVQESTEFKRIQAALRTSEAEFRTLVETMPQIVWVTRPDGWHTDFNQSWLDFTGLTLEESLGFGWNPPFHPEDRESAAEHWRQATNSGEPYEIEYRLRRWDGVYHWMLGRAVPMRDAEGNIVKWFGTCTDIDALKGTQKRLDEAQRVGKIGDWEYSPITEKTIWSPEVYRILKRDIRLGPPQMLHESAVLFDTESAVLLKKMISLETASGQIEKFDLRTNAGDREESYVQVVAVPRKGDRGEVVGFFGTLQDITERKQAELALKENQDLLERTNQVARVGGWETDLATGSLQWTSGTRDILEVDRTEPAPPLDDALPKFYKGEYLEWVSKNLQHAMDHGVTADFDTQLQTKTGRLKWVRIQAQPEIQDGKTVRLLGTFQDISERKELENRLSEWGTAFKAAGDGVIITDAEECITAVNPAFTAITGYSEEEVRGCSAGVLQFDSCGGYTEEPVKTGLKAQGHWQGEIGGRRKNGEVFPTLQSINAITDEVGRITRYVSTLTDLTQIKTAEQQLEYLAYHDPLTGLPNRRLFTDRLEQAVVHGRRSSKPFAVLLLDLNDFKALNDGFGHEMGDQALKGLGARVQKMLKADDMVARWGGDELVLLFRELEDASEISPLVEWVLEALETPFLIGGQEFRLSASIGVAVGGASEQSASSLIMQADGAMYAAKKAGHRFAYYAQEMGEAARERLYLGTELARALESNQLEIHYQPQVDLRSGQCLGLEALARWHHPDEGWISPGRFIPLAEQTGLIHKLGEWVLEKACLEASQWLADGRDFGQLAINVASQQLSSNALVGQIDRILSQTGFPPSRLELELTEFSLVEPGLSVFETLEALRDRGICISIDDFGTGYSSLGYLKDLPVDRLKIDRSFVDGLPQDEKSRALVQTIITLGSKLGFQIVAEGIETPAQAQALIQDGCFAGQGYLLAKPLDPEAVRALQFPLPVPFVIMS